MSKFEVQARMSVLYNYVRSRQLEGTFPGSPETGVWPITAMRISFGWGWILDSKWPREHPPSWPPSIEPPGLDDLAKQHRINHYVRVRTLDECKRTLAFRGPVLSSFRMSSEWYDAPNGVIPVPSTDAEFVAAHSVLLVGYDDTEQQFTFMNSWGSDWGDSGFGHMSYAAFEATWDEGWFMDVTYPNFPEAQQGFSERTWGFTVVTSGIECHCVELLDQQGTRIAWALAVKRESQWLEVEELFVRPQFRKQRHGAQLIHTLKERADQLGCSIRLWISYADTEASNIAIIDRLIAPLELVRKHSDERWAPMCASPRSFDNRKPQIPHPPSRPHSPFTSR